MSIPTAEILEGLERCNRIAFWRCDWEKNRLTPAQFLEAGVRAALQEPDRKDIGQLAGETLYELAVTKELETKQQDVHSQIVHLAALADIVSTALRGRSEAPWLVPDPVDGWISNCLLSPDGSHLRRVIFVQNWSDERHYSVCRAWSSLGEVCHLAMPMQIAVIVAGQHKDGKYRSFWTRGLVHPANGKLRFRKKHQIDTPFKDSWQETWREDRDDITTQDWLQAMIGDGVLQDLCFKVDLPLPDKIQRQKIIDLEARKVDLINAMESLPDPNLSTCDWPTICPMRGPCHANQEPSRKWGFVPVQEILPQSSP